jgi:hypothetical protein
MKLAHVRRRTDGGDRCRLSTLMIPVPTIDIGTTGPSPAVDVGIKPLRFAGAGDKMHLGSYGRGAQRQRVLTLSEQEVELS